MRHTALILLIGAFAVSCTAWASAGEAKKDVCKDCVDPYNPTVERGRFFKAAGADNELDAKEFETDKARAEGFVRKFDTWAGILAFDKNGGKTIDWFEADAYRRDLRKRVLGAYDADKDGHLKDKERDAANLALAAGKLPAAPKTSGTVGKIIAPRGSSPPAGGIVRPGGAAQPLVVRRGPGQSGPVIVRPGGGQLSEEEMKKRREEYARKAADHRKLYQDMVKKHDTNGDGRINTDERKAFYDDYRRQSEIRRWDTSGDGRLDDAEKQAMEAKKVEWKKRSEDARHKWMLQRWDKDKSGDLSDEEKGAMEAQQAEWKEQAEKRRRDYEELRKKHDTDGDGKLDADERKAYSEEIQQRWRLRRWDENKNGKLDDAEREAMEAQQAEWKKRSEDARRKYELRRYDQNGNGQLDEPERKKMEEDRARWRRPGRVMINGQPVGAGGMTVMQSDDGRTHTVILTRPGGEDERYR